MTRRPLRLATGLALAAAVLWLPAPALAKKKARPIKTLQLPVWAREALVREIDPGDADLVWLHVEQIVEPVAAGGVRTTRRIAVRPVNRSGLEDATNQYIYYHRGDTIQQIRAWVVKGDGFAYPLDEKEDVSDWPSVEELGFNDSRMRVIELTGVAPGMTALFEWSYIEQLDVGSDYFIFGSAGEPTALARYEVRVPPGWQLEMFPFRDDGLERSEASTTAGTVFTARDLHPLPDERLRPPARTQMPMVWAHWWSPDGSRGYETWDDVAVWYEEFSVQTRADLGEAAVVGARLKPSTPDRLLDALIQAFDFAARDVRYVSIDMGLGKGAGFLPATPAAVCKNRYGDCKDKSFLLRGLTADWGLETYPVLVRTGDRGPVLEEVPTMGQFNHCIAAVVLPEGVGLDLWSATEVDGVGRVVLLDATASTSGPWDLPTGVQGTRAMLMKPDRAVAVQVPVQPPETARTVRRLDASVGPGGELVEARLTEEWSGTRASWVRNLYQGLDEAGHRKQVLHDLQDRFPGTAVADYSISGLDDYQSPVIETTTVKGGRVGKRVGNLLILEPGKFGYGMLGRPLPPPPRTLPLSVGAPREEQLEIVLALPTGWTPEEVPQGIAVSGHGIEATSTWSVEDGKLIYRRTARLITNRVDPDDYEAFREDLHRLQGEDSQGVVLIQR